MRDLGYGPAGAAVRPDLDPAGRVASVAPSAGSRAPAGPVVLRAGVKRALDLLLASALLVTCLPVLLAAAAAIRLDSRGPALFIQTRVGRHGRRFRIYKLRTLYADRRPRGQVLAQDPRITRVGRWLRRSGLDELPQLWNVVRGEMSLVGPRPYALADDRRFARRLPGYARRRAVRPGISGWAQVHCPRGAVVTPAQLARRTRYDLAYAVRPSLGRDAEILLRTAALLLSGGRTEPRRD
jgi:putative colanic acid biosynthesis UDP-glucose lipid carrier transferase